MERKMVRGKRIWERTIFLTVFMLTMHLCGPGMTISDDTGLTGGTLDQPLELGLSLERAMAFQGESVPFVVTLSHSALSAVSVASFLDENRSVKLLLKGPGGRTWTADQLSHRERDGIITLERRTPAGVSLKPGEKLVLRGDLLEWFGPVPSGRYQVEAAYAGILRTAQSKPVNLGIAPVALVSAAVSQDGAQSGETPISAAWIMKDKEALQVFYQLLSPLVPRNPLRGVKAARLQGPLMRFGAAALAGPDYPSGAIYWMKDDRNLLFTHVDLNTGSSCPPMQVGMPSGAVLAGSPLLLKDRTLLVPLMLEDEDRFALVRLSYSGNKKVHKFKVKGLSEAEHRVCFWESDQRLHLFWSTSGENRVAHTVLNLKRIPRGFSKHKSIRTADTVSLIRPYLDRSLPVGDLRALYLGEGSTSGAHVKPRLKLWCVSAGSEGLSASRIDAGSGETGQTVTLRTKKAQGLQFLNVAVNGENGLCLLMKDDDDRLWYGSTVRGSLELLDKAAGRKIRASDSPVLLASRTAPWVHLQYVRNNRSLEYARLEPGDEPDPVEKSQEGR